MRLGLRLLFAFLALPSVWAQDAKSVYHAADREPTPTETLILEYFNRFRANPKAEFDLIAPMEGIDWKMFKDEMMALTKAPPLVFNLELLDAARKHSHYMILNGQVHEESAEKSGFTGITPTDRVKASGYQSYGAAENIYLGIKDAWSSHWGFVVDFGKN